jgi:hypothetical protein
MPQPNPSIDAHALLPLYLSDEEAARRYGEGSSEGSEWRAACSSLTDLAEEAKSEIESSFETPLSETEDDLETLDLVIADGWQDRPPSEEELAAIAASWGAYLGHLILQNVGGQWVVRPEAHRNSLRFPRLGTQFFPIHAILRRFALGRAGSLVEAYDRLLAELSR